MWTRTNVIGTPQPGVGAPRGPYRVTCDDCPDFAPEPTDDLDEATATQRAHIREQHPA